MSDGKQRRIFGFDYGLSQLGVALLQLPLAIITPMSIIRCRDGKPDWEAVEQLVEEWQPDCCVVGLPLNMDGSEGPITPRAQKFARQLHGRFGLNVDHADERLSSVEAKERLYIGGKTNYKKRPADSIAAQVILETWLHESHKNS